MQQYENYYILDEYLFRDEYYKAHVWVKTNINPTVENDWGWDLTKLVLYNIDWELQYLFVNPSFTMLSDKQQNYIDSSFLGDYIWWKFTKDDPDWHRELWLSEYL